MYPLLYRDGVALQYLVLTLGYNWLVGYNPFRLRGFVKLLSLVRPSAFSLSPPLPANPSSSAIHNRPPTPSSSSSTPSSCSSLPLPISPIFLPSRT